MSWTYHRSMKTAPPTVREILRSLKKCITFKILSQICTFDVILFPGLCWFWKCLICHFPNSVCPPYWSKWTTVFSLLLLENLSNSSQNCLRWSLDWAEQNLLNWFFVLIFVQKLWCCECQSWPKIGSEAVISAKLWSIETKLGMLHQSPDLRVNTKVGNSATYGYWDRKMSHILLITLDDLLVMVITCKLTNFGVSRTNSIAPPPVQIFNIEIIITHKPLVLGE